MIMGNARRHVVRGLIAMAGLAVASCSNSGDSGAAGDNAVSVGGLFGLDSAVNRVDDGAMTRVDEPVGNEMSDLEATDSFARATGPAGWTLPMPVSKLSQADRDAIMQAAGHYKHNDGWNVETIAERRENAATDPNGCPADIAESGIRDLNGDGVPEVITISTGTYCYGNTGQAFAIVGWTPSGWRKFIDAAGIPRFYRRAGSPWPDIEIGGPGFCFPRVRWSGTDYSASAGRSYGNKPCRSPDDDVSPAPPPPASLSPSSAALPGRTRSSPAPTAPSLATPPGALASPDGRPPVRLGRYAVNQSCRDAGEGDDYLVLSAHRWSEIDGDTPILAWRPLGGNRWAAGPGIVISVVSERRFVEHGRVMTWCGPA